MQFWSVLRTMTTTGRTSGTVKNELNTCGRGLILMLVRERLKKQAQKERNERDKSENRYKIIYKHLTVITGRSF